MNVTLELAMMAAMGVCMILAILLFYGASAQERHSDERHR